MPNTLAGLLVFVVLLIPGYAYQHRRARDIPERDRSTFAETLAVVFVSVIVGWIALVAYALVARLLPDSAPSPAQLFTNPAQYTGQHFLAVVLWSASFVGFAALLGHTLAARPWRVLDRTGRFGSRARLKEAQHSAWWLAFHEHPGSTMHVGCVLHDGSYVAGILHSYSRVSAEHGDRDLTLRGEITYRAARAEATHTLPNVNLVVISARDITLLTVTYVHHDTAPSASLLPSADQRPEQVETGQPRPRSANDLWSRASERLCQVSGGVGAGGRGWRSGRRGG